MNNLLNNKSSINKFKGKMLSWCRICKRSNPILAINPLLKNKKHMKVLKLTNFQKVHNPIKMIMESIKI